MAENTKISWCDHTINLWWGCAKVHSGCDNCYAEALSHRFGNNVWGNDNPRKEINSAFEDLDKYQRNAKKEGVKKKVFVGSMMDIFEKPMPVIHRNGHIYPKLTTGRIREHFFNQIKFGQYPDLIFLLLTKRPSNINKYIPEEWLIVGAPKNVWFGTSPVDQKTFDTLVPQLQMVKGNKFLSIEPQLGIIDKIDFKVRDGNEWNLQNQIRWIIQGGESGPNKRPFDLEWVHPIRKHCDATRTPYFFKQIDKVKPIPKNYFCRQFPNFER